MSKIKRDLSRNDRVSLLKQVFSKTNSRIPQCRRYTSKNTVFFQNVIKYHNFRNNYSSQNVNSNNCDINLNKDCENLNRN